MYITDNFYKHYPTAKDLAIAVFFAVDHDEVLDIPVVEKLLGQNLHLLESADDIVKLTIAYSKQYVSQKDLLLSRLKSNYAIRSLTRNVHTSSSSSAISKLIIQELGMILSSLCQIEYKDLFNKDNLETLIELVEDEDHLKNEFITFIETSSKYIHVMKNDSNPNIKKLDKITPIFASYLFSYLNNQDDLTTIKQKINDSLSEI